jgi:hypothetical protein
MVYERVKLEDLKPHDEVIVNGLRLSVGLSKNGRDAKSALYDTHNGIHGWGMLSEPGVVLLRAVEHKPLDDEALDRAIADEALRRHINGSRHNVAAEGAFLARTGWQPPAPVDPLLLEARELVAAHTSNASALILDGKWDDDYSIKLVLAALQRGYELGLLAKGE